MFQLPDSMGRPLATALLLSSFVLSGPSRADQALPGQKADSAPGAAVLAEAATPEAAPAPGQTPSKETAGSRSNEDYVETRIKDLHEKLKITAAQESQWKTFTDVMRDNAQTVDAVLKERSENLHAMNAVDDLRSYEKLADAHADGLRKLVPAFEALYKTMSEDQKRTADVVFAQHEKRPQHASSK